MRKLGLLTAAALVMSAVGFSGTAGAQDRVESEAPIGALVSPSAAALAAAITASLTSNSCLINATLTEGVDQAAIFTIGTPLQGFPTDGTSNDYVVLSSGLASAAPGVATTFLSIVAGGPGLAANATTAHPVNPSLDTVTLDLTFALPASPGILSFDWKYGTEENPTFLGPVFTDYFRAFLTDAVPTTTSLAFLDINTAIGISNAPGGSSAAPTAPFPVPDDVVYNAMTTGLQGVAFDLNPNANTTVTLSLRVADAGDLILDTAAFIDNLQIAGCQTVEIDIKFCSDPNGFNSRRTRGVVPLTIFGTAGLDVNDIDLSSLQLCLADDLATCTGAPVTSSIADRGNPDTDIGAAQCAFIAGVEQDFLNPDGFNDLDVGFLASEVCDVIECDSLTKGDDSPTLVLTGNLNGGEPFQSIPVDDNAIDQLAIKR